MTDRTRLVEIVEEIIGDHRMGHVRIIRCPGCTDFLFSAKALDGSDPIKGEPADASWIAQIVISDRDLRYSDLLLDRHRKDIRKGWHIERYICHGEPAVRITTAIVAADLLLAHQD